MSHALRAVVLMGAILLVASVLSSPHDATLRLDVVEVPDEGKPVVIESRALLGWDYSTPVLQVYVRSDALFADGFDP